MEYVTEVGVREITRRFPEGDRWRGVLNAVQAILQHPEVNFYSLISGLRASGGITDEPYVPPEPPREVA